MLLLTEYSIFAFSSFTKTMNNDFTLDDLANKSNILSRNDLVSFFREKFPGISGSNINWKIRNLVRKGSLKRAGFGVYIRSDKTPFEIENYEIVPVIGEYLRENFPELEYSIWDTRTLGRFSLHQSARFMIILEVNRGSELTIFNFLKDEFNNLFVNPGRKEYDLYITDCHDPVVIKAGVTQAPLKFKEGVSVPRLEKILVDLFVDDIIFTPFQGSELVTIYKSAFALHPINFSSLLRYAGRRGARKKIMQLLSETGLCDSILKVEP